MEEARTWVGINGYEGLYVVSNFGDIMSLPKTRNNALTGGVSVFPAKILAQSDRRGYRGVSLCAKGDCVSRNVHRLVAIAFIPNPMNLPCVNHKDGNKTNNHVSNLEWVTYQENDIHSVKIGLKPMGSKHYTTKLSEEDVVFIRKSPLTNKCLAQKYGIGQNAISNIRLRVNWKHV